MSTASEAFHQDGPWIISSDGLRVRALGRAGMQYVRESVTLDLDAEALATDGFVLYPGNIPNDLRDRVVDDVTRAWRWAGFEMQIIQP